MVRTATLHSANRELHEPFSIGHGATVCCASEEHSAGVVFGQFEGLDSQGNLLVRDERHGLLTLDQRTLLSGEALSGAIFRMLSGDWLVTRDVYDRQGCHTHHVRGMASFNPCLSGGYIYHERDLCSRMAGPASLVEQLKVIQRGELIEFFSHVNHQASQTHMLDLNFAAPLHKDGLNLVESRPSEGDIAYSRYAFMSRDRFDWDFKTRRHMKSLTVTSSFHRKMT